MDAVSGIGGVPAALPLPQATVPAAADRSGDPGFGASLTGAIDDLRALQSEADALKVAAVTGDLDDIHAAMIASTRAAVTLELVAAVRNKGVDAFTEIMRMQA